MAAIVLGAPRNISVLEYGDLIGPPMSGVANGRGCIAFRTGGCCQALLGVRVGELVQDQPDTAVDASGWSFDYSYESIPRQRR